eukprot:gnl/TRDRNA2_/TRDRNA2_85121_c0_seq1.p1 gnl/TRDRNA2_/TRDRNA2_85121_c0~~gnl/TRDRNA2_/TRDRNA2_85121_c0_seq1.p1  ORF type:complete len:315 (-),score=42.06 gnl/TRDRNA2_/TRDRNA2_85121_c0_seq1:876-1820(-)
MRAGELVPRRRKRWRRHGVQREVWRCVALVVGTRLRSSAAFVPGEGQAPYYCPPLHARSCVRQYRFGKYAPYVEETAVPWTIRVLITLAQEGQGSVVLGPALEALLGMAEGISILTCSLRFMDCYHEPSLRAMHGEVCAAVARYQRELLQHGLDGLEEPLCGPLLGRGEGNKILSAMAVPLQSLVRRILPQAAPAELGNNYCRFNFEHFLSERGRLYSQRTEAGWSPLPLNLTYPAQFSPGLACSACRQTAVKVDFDAMDVGVVLERLAAAGVPLSHFVINFGAADGQCGAMDSWNQDPCWRGWPQPVCRCLIL